MDVITVRRIKLSVTIGGHDATNFMEPYLLSFSYTDNATDKADSVQLEVHDREGKWAGEWAPKKGTNVTASFQCLYWFEKGQHGSLNCGSFTVDEVDYSGPPDKVSIKAVSASLTGSLRETANTRAWEKYSLQGVAGELASTHGLDLLYDAPPLDFARQDQREESDLAFLSRIANQRGVNVKVHDGKLALYEARRGDGRSASLTIPKTGGQFSPKSYSFKETSTDTAYTGCTVAYNDPDTGQTHSYHFDAKGQRTETAVEGARKEWKLNGRVESEAEARTLAQNAVRRKNEGECTGNLEIMGHPGLVAGITLNLTGFGRFSGVYFVETAEHKVGDGYTTSAELRKTLGY